MLSLFLLLIHNFAINQNKLCNGEGIVLQLVTELGLEVTQLFLQLCDAHQDDVLRLERSDRLNSKVKLVWLACVVVRSLELEKIELFKTHERVK